ncbi:hypothetical protein BDV95DRAFT_122968 [Massariosphaeria phaeospora]|uniref:Uncharacterized protein n=1 Tax=Massariosphaeria phaeospora TaxID=100035 RepID=A0A7C8I5N4_9PLEO|nr:hypothetical protein BDV95DRAFT_122968 [Massariosphaeria phaeospora]
MRKKYISFRHRGCSATCSLRVHDHLGLKNSSVSDMERVEITWMIRSAAIDTRALTEAIQHVQYRYRHQVVRDPFRNPQPPEPSLSSKHPHANPCRTPPPACFYKYSRKPSPSKRIDCMQGQAVACIFAQCDSSSISAPTLVADAVSVHRSPSAGHRMPLQESQC